MIAFTSQMAHVVSNAYIKSPTAAQHKGFSAGSYKDMTRVAWLNPQMWAELFMENKDFLIEELDFFMHSMQQYRDALASGDTEGLTRLLDEGRKKKAEVARIRRADRARHTRRRRGGDRALCTKGAPRGGYRRGEGVFDIRRAPSRRA